jgi:hypothetical protein
MIEDFTEYIELIDLWKMRLSMSSSMEHTGELLKEFTKEYDKIFSWWEKENKNV